MKLTKNIVSAFLTGAMLLGNSSIVFADNINPEQITESIQTSEKQAKVKWTGSAYVSKDYWCNVTSSNNIFPDEPLVTNNANNAGQIKVRIINSKGVQVGSEKTISAGKSVRLDKIPAFSGTYTLQAKAVNSSGNYTISID